MTKFNGTFPHLKPPDFFLLCLPGPIGSYPTLNWIIDYIRPDQIVLDPIMYIHFNLDKKTL